MISRPWLIRLERGLLLVGLVLIGLWLKNTLDARRFQEAQSRRFDAARREADLVGPPAPAPATGSRPRSPVTPGRGVIGRLEIPRLGISAMVVEGTDARSLARAVGHIRRTALPGRPGNVGLAGHRDTFLRGLGGVRARDVVRIVTLRGTITYEVEWGEVVEPGRVDVLDSTATRSVTLVTCYPFHAVGPAPERFVVRARQVDPAVAAASAGP